MAEAVSTEDLSLEQLLTRRRERWVVICKDPWLIDPEVHFVIAETPEQAVVKVIDTFPCTGQPIAVAIDQLELWVKEILECEEREFGAEVERRLKTCESRRNTGRRGA